MNSAFTRFSRLHPVSPLGPSPRALVASVPPRARLTQTIAAHSPMGRQGQSGDPLALGQELWLPRRNFSYDATLCASNKSAEGPAARFCTFRRKLLLGQARAPLEDTSLVVSRSALFDEGGSNTIRRLAPKDEELCRRRGIPMRQWPQTVSALLRTSKPRARPHAVRDAWVQWELSRLAVAPPTFAVWLECTASCCEAVRLHSIVQEWGGSLKHPSARGVDAIAGSKEISQRRHERTARSPHAREQALEEAVVEQVRAVARSGLVLTDIKSAHVLVRQRSADIPELQAIPAQWEVRLVDFDHPFARPVPCVSADCRLLFMLSLLAAEMACGPAHRSAFAAEIASLSQKETQCAASLLGHDLGVRGGDATDDASRCAAAALGATMRMVKRTRAFLDRNGTDPAAWQSFRSCVLDLRRGGFRSLERRGWYNFSSWVQTNQTGSSAWIQVNREGYLRSLLADV